VSSGASSNELKRAKREVRGGIRAARDAIPPSERAELGARAVGYLLEMPEVTAAGTIMAFWSFGSEVPTEPLVQALHDRGAALVLPRIAEDGLVPLAYAPGDPTTATAFGAREPILGARRVNPASIDVVVTPGLAFDRRGGRVGYGGGFYDRFFRVEAPQAFRVGLAFEMQLLDDVLPAGHGDLRVHAVVTEEGVTRFEVPSAPLEPRFKHGV
jgi:5-formyltetrahydrofolate cyclo-ligase